MDPIDEALEFSKSAALVGPPGRFGEMARGAGRALKDPLIGATAMAGAGAMMGGVMMAAQKIYGAATKSSDFHTMLENNADLREHENPHMVGMAFTTLRRFAPDFSADPLVSGTFVRRMVASPEHAGMVIQEALGGQGKIQPSLGADLARGGALQGMKFKEPKDFMAKDLEHQTRLEGMRADIRDDYAQRAEARRGPRPGQGGQGP